VYRSFGAVLVGANHNAATIADFLISVPFSVKAARLGPRWLSMIPPWATISSFCYEMTSEG